MLRCLTSLTGKNLQQQPITNERNSFIANGYGNDSNWLVTPISGQEYKTQFTSFTRAICMTKDKIHEALAFTAGNKGSNHALELVSILDRLQWENLADGVIVQGAKNKMTERLEGLVNAGVFTHVFDMSRSAKTVLKNHKKEKGGADIIDGHLRVTVFRGGKEYYVTVGSRVDRFTPTFLLCPCDIHSTRISTIGKIASRTMSLRNGQ